MADVIRKVTYYKVMVSQRPGEAHRILNQLKEAGINLLAFTGFPRGQRAQLDFIPENAAAFQRFAQKTGLAISEKKVGFLVQGADRVGAVADVIAPLAEAGINITALDAVSAGEGRWGAIFWVKPEDVRKVARILKAS